MGTGRGRREGPDGDGHEDEDENGESVIADDSGEVISESRKLLICPGTDS
jgi:hypothetical protein